MSDSTERNCNKCIHHTSGMCDSWNCKMQTVEDAKKEAVNEYVKAVVAELDEVKMRYFLAIANTRDEKSDFAYENVGNALDKAIEIVKHGGVSDDVCEWKQTSTAKYKTECGYNLEEYFDTKACCCKQCGKKIKVVERMKINIDEKIIADSIKYYGKELQSIVCMEECSELIQAISKELRGKSDKNHLAEEMADVMICINMLREMYEIGTSELESWIYSKQQRCKERMVTE